MLKRQEVVGLLIGLLITMAVVALTLPSEKTKEVNKVCYEDCKMLIKEDKKKRFWSGASYFNKLGECMEACTEEKHESID